MNIKSRKEILTDMIVWMRNNTSAITDFNQGSVIRSIFNAVSSQIAHLYYDALKSFRESRITFASGSDLDVAVADRSIKRKGATKASVILRFTGILTTTIPTGTKVATGDGIEFATTVEKSIGDDGGGNTVDITAEAVVAGTSGNVRQETINQIIDTIDNITKATNPDSSVGGFDYENDTQLRNRAIMIFDSLAQGTQASYNEWAKQANIEVLRARAQVYHPSYSDATIIIHVVKTNAGTFTIAELESIENYIQVRCTLGLYVKCLNITWETVNISAQIRRKTGYSLQETENNIIDNLQKYLDYRDWDWGQDIEWSDVYSLINNTFGVQDLSPSQFIPSSNIIVSDNSLPKIGSITLIDW